MDTPNNDETADVGTNLAAFLIGAAGGAALALLYSPASGRKTREYLGQRARQVRHQATKAATKTRDFVDQGRRAAVTIFEHWRQIQPSIETTMRSHKGARRSHATSHRAANLNGRARAVTSREAVSGVR